MWGGGGGGGVRGEAISRRLVSRLWLASEGWFQKKDVFVLNGD